VNLKSAFHLRRGGPNRTEAAWEVYWSTARHSGYSWRSAVGELRKRGYAKDICLPAEYTDESGGGQLMGMAVVPSLKYDAAYARYLMAGADASGDFVYEEWAV
jgi:hypothetical protein